MADIHRHTVERIEFADPVTRAHIVQLTSNPTMSVNLYFEETPFTPDSRTLIFKSRRGVLRGDPWDLYRVNADGSDLVQLTDCPFSDAVLARDGERAFYSTAGEVRTVRLDDGREDVLARFDGCAAGELTVGGEFVFCQVFDKGVHRMVRVPVAGGAPDTIREGGFFCHFTASPTGNWVSWVGINEVTGGREGTWRVMRGDGTGERPWAVQEWSHSAWVGTSDRMQGGLLPPYRALSWIAPEESEHAIIAEGAYFVHSSANADGEWIVSDTNWPNIGLQLVHVPSGRWGLLCLDQASYGHPQYTHPHPVLSPDGRKVLYTSDRTGIAQVYLVDVPDWLRDELRTGSLSNRHRVASRTNLGDG